MNSKHDIKYAAPFVILAIFFWWEAAAVNVDHFAPALDVAATAQPAAAAFNFPVLDISAN